ncbi:MAG: hypothetical protein ACOZIN_08560 [Myxococcota bacterium]
MDEFISALLQSREVGATIGASIGAAVAGWAAVRRTMRREVRGIAREEADAAIDRRVRPAALRAGAGGAP